MEAVSAKRRGRTVTVEQRISAAQQLSPEMCSLNMGSMNFALYPMARRHTRRTIIDPECRAGDADAFARLRTFLEHIENLSRSNGCSQDRPAYYGTRLLAYVQIVRPTATFAPAAGNVDSSRERPRSAGDRIAWPFTPAC
jgi:uncharacterized protein (DUF849 family)